MAIQNENKHGHRAKSHMGQINQLEFPIQLSDEKQVAEKLALIKLVLRGEDYDD